MSNRTISKVIWISVAVLLVAWDFVPFLDPARGDTLSEVLAKWGLHMFSLPLIFGVLCGHFFFLRDGVRPNPKILIPIALTSITLDVISKTGFDKCAEMLQKAQLHPWIWLLIGIPIGALWWPQSKKDKE